MEKKIDFDPRRSCVLVIDMTNDAIKPDGVYSKELEERFFDQEELIHSNRRLIEAARAANVPVIFTHTARKPGEPRYLKHFVPALGHRARTYKAESLIEGSWGDEIIDELKPLPTEHVISKKRRSAFLGTPLDLILRSMETTTLVITGIGTPGCVESTVWSAFDHDYYIVMPKECTSTTNGKQDKEEALAHMGGTCAVISNVDAVISALRSPVPIPLLSLQAQGL
jgi:nicotinamidase-related amidase